VGLQQKAAESVLALKAFDKVAFRATERELQDEWAWLKEFERGTTANAARVRDAGSGSYGGGCDAYQEADANDFGGGTRYVHAGAAMSTATTTAATTPHLTGATPAAHVVTADHLTKRFGDLVAVDDLTFSLEAGTVTGFLGPNGAGKTTTLRMLLGLVRPTSGTALVFGQRYAEQPDPALRVGAVLEAADFHPGRTGREHLITLGLAAALPVRRVDEVLDLVELTDAARRRVKTYSLGMRQRLGLAAALLGNPELLVLDEPANGLDPEGVHWLRTFLRDFASYGKTVFVSSHVLAEVAQTVDRVVIIDKGRLVTIAALDELTERIAGSVRVRAPHIQALLPALAAAGFESTVLDGDELRVRGATSAQIGELAARAGILLHELVQESSTLESVFLKLTSEKKP
jgi:ABC-2 type transport system ATP-binding protein